MDFDLTAGEKATLLETAREMILAHLEKRDPRLPSPDESLSVVCGAFVTLRTSKGALRGCIGNVAGSGPLFDTVCEMAVASAFQDPRFSPVKKDEVPDLRMEISVLSPLREASCPDEVIPGTHGIYIRRGYNAGLLLPQVATEQGWNREQFLSHGCMKAGLPPDAWRIEGTRISVFTALVFSE